MQIDPRLNDIDDCLYRVSTKAIIMQGNKLLLIKEIPEMWWGFPGGGVDHGETVEASLIREVEEELGVPAKDISPDFTIAHHTIGTVLNGVPRMNLFFRVEVPQEAIKKTAYAAEWRWFTKDEFIHADMSRSYKKRAELANAIFGG